MMKKLLLLFLLVAGCISSLTAQNNLDYWPSKKHSNGRYGYDKGSATTPAIEPVFEWAASFSEGSRLSLVRHNKRYYLIDRSGFLFEDRSYEFMSDAPECYQYFLLYHQEGSTNGDYLTDLSRQRISPKGTHIKPLKDGERQNNPSLFMMRDAGSKLYTLVDVKCRPISSVQALSFRPLIYAEHLIEFETESGYGVMNANGEVILPAQFDMIDEDGMYSGYTKLKEALAKAGMASLEWQNITLFFTRNGSFHTIYDAAGYRITPPMKSKNRAQLLNKATKNYLVPYFKDYYRHEPIIKQRGVDAYQARRQAHDRITAKMRQQPRVTSIDFEKKVKLELAKKEKEAAKQRAVAAQTKPTTTTTTTTTVAARPTTSTQTSVAKSTTTTQQSAPRKRNWLATVGKIAQVAAGVASGNMAMATAAVSGNSAAELQQLFSYSGTVRQGQTDHTGHVIRDELNAPTTGGQAHYVFYEDGYCLSTAAVTCVHCYGKGVCYICNGAGSYYHAYFKTNQPCPTCGGHGVCQNCHGIGYLVTTHLMAPGEAEAYLQAHREVQSSSSSSSSHSHSHSSSSSGVCPDCGGKGYRPESYQYAAQSDMAPYHNSGGDECPICGSHTDHYHYRCTTCKRH